MISPEEHLNCKVHDRRGPLTVTRPCRRPVPVTYNASPRNATSPLAQSNLHSICCIISTKDQLLHSALHGTAIRYAVEKRDLADSIAELREIADGRNDVLAEAAGITAGSWYAWPSTHIGHELIAAGMLIMAGGGNGTPLDYDELERWTRVGFERGTRSRNGER